MRTIKYWAVKYGNNIVWEDCEHCQSLYYESRQAHYYVEGIINDYYLCEEHLHRIMMNSRNINFEYAGEKDI